MNSENKNQGRRPVLETPRIVLWLGSGFTNETDLLLDLQRLPVIGVFQEVRQPIIENALHRNLPLNSRMPAPITSAAEALAWNPEQLPIIYLNGKEGDEPLSELEAAHERATMLHCFRVLANRHRPSVIALGLDGQGKDLATLLAVATEYGNFSPVLIGDRSGTIEESWERLRAPKSRALVEPQVVEGDWLEVKQSLHAAGIPIFLDQAARPTITVGDLRVPLDKVWADPEQRIDHTYRVITTRALAAVPAELNFGDLFEAVMRADEAKDASTAEDDVKEWWGIGERIAIERPGQAASGQRLLDTLGPLRSKDGYRSSPKTCWLAAEPGSGATIYLHALALKAAEAGYPTLVAKQLAREPYTRQVRDFLFNLDREAKELAFQRGSDHSEQPVLLVLDVPHKGVPGFEELVDELVRVAGRPVLTLRAVRIPVGAPAPAGRVNRGEWLASHLGGSGSDRVMPDKHDEVLDILRAEPSREEIALIQTKAAWLRNERSVHIRERTLDTWDLFQKQNAYEVDQLLTRAGILRSSPDFETAKHEFRAANHFWVSLHYFLSETHLEDGGDPLASALLRRSTQLPAKATAAGLNTAALLGILLETAKQSAWQVVTPLMALTDFLRAQLKNIAQAEAQQIQAADDRPPSTIQQLVERLQAWASGTAPSVSRGRIVSPELSVYRIVDLLVQENLLRRHSIGADAYVTVPHPQMARYVLLAALGNSLGVPEKLIADIGGVEAVIRREHAFKGFRTLLGCLKVAEPNLRLCENLSETLLQGGDELAEWRDARGQLRLDSYDLIPEGLRGRSRVLLHHHAMVLRRSTFYPPLGAQEKVHRLERAKLMLAQALSLPWAMGERDEHPAFIRTTLGLVLATMALHDSVNRRRLRAEARAELSAGLVEIPHSRHTRMALAGLCVEDAEFLSGSPAVEDREKAVGLAAECLRLLSVRPTSQFDRWYKTQVRAATIFGDDAGRHFVEDLCAKRVEDGFLLKAELFLAQADPSGRARATQDAIALLEPLVRGGDALTRPRIARRLAELLVGDLQWSQRFDERDRLLRAVEVALKDLTPHEEFQLAYLAYQVGQYNEGKRRYAIFRSRGRQSAAGGEEKPFLIDPASGKPLACQGRVKSVEGWTGWMRVESKGKYLFDAPFSVRHFGESVTQHRTYPSVVRFLERGPRVVPPRFADYGVA